MNPEIPKHTDVVKPLSLLQSLRLPANYGATFGVKKLLTNVPVGKPKKANFFRTHTSTDMIF